MRCPVRRISINWWLGHSSMSDSYRITGLLEQSFIADKPQRTRAYMRSINRATGQGSCITRVSQNKGVASTGPVMRIAVLTRSIASL